MGFRFSSLERCRKASLPPDRLGAVSSLLGWGTGGWRSGRLLSGALLFRWLLGSLSVIHNDFLGRDWRHRGLQGLDLGAQLIELNFFRTGQCFHAIRKRASRLFKCVQVVA